MGQPAEGALPVVAAGACARGGGGVQGGGEPPERGDISALCPPSAAAPRPALLSQSASPSTPTPTSTHAPLPLPRFPQCPPPPLAQEVRAAERHWRAFQRRMHALAADIQRRGQPAAGDESLAAHLLRLRYPHTGQPLSGRQGCVGCREALWGSRCQVGRAVWGLPAGLCSTNQCGLPDTYLLSGRAFVGWLYTRLLPVWACGVLLLVGCWRGIRGGLGWGIKRRGCPSVSCLSSHQTQTSCWSLPAACSRPAGARAVHVFRGG